MDWYSLGVLIYELIVGFPPYFDNEKEILYDNIKRGTLKLPKTLSLDVKDLILKVIANQILFISSSQEILINDSGQIEMEKKFGNSDGLLI